MAIGGYGRRYRGTKLKGETDWAFCKPIESDDSSDTDYSVLSESLLEENILEEDKYEAEDDSCVSDLSVNRIFQLTACIP
mgnify:CR=1 FL=1